jgi:hypothetical protein
MILCASRGIDGAMKVNVSAIPVVLVPCDVSTVTSTLPFDSAGEVAVMEVDEPTLNSDATVTPKSTDVTPEKFVPVMVTRVPPAVEPTLGLMSVTVGIGPRKWNSSSVPLAFAPPLVVTITLTLPLDSAGDVALIEVPDTTTKAAGTRPNITLEAPESSVPVMITTVPPLSGPESGLRRITVGRGGRNVNRSDGPVALLPPVVVTVTSIRPGAIAGAKAMIEVSEWTVNEDAAFVPKSTALTPVKFVPLMVTLVPPVSGPEFGRMVVTAGSGGVITKVNLSADEMGVVPAGVTTVTAVSPAFSEGDMAAMDESEITENDEAGCVPKSTAVAPVKFVPLMITFAPPAVEPDVGLSRVTVGWPGGVTKVNLSAFRLSLVPPGPETQTSIVPGSSAGDTAEIELSEVTTKEDAGTVPK